MIQERRKSFVVGRKRKAKVRIVKNEMKDIVCDYFGSLFEEMDFMQ